MNISGIISKIENNPELIEVILEALGHCDVRDRGRYYQCSNLDGDNHTAISILKEGLLYNNYTRGRKGNIFSLVMDEKDVSFGPALRFVANTIGYDDTKNRVRYPFSGFYRSLTSSDHNLDTEITTYSEDLLPSPDALSEMWFKDGVDYLTQERFGIRIDFDSNRIVIPEYNVNGELVGAKARYNGECDPSDRWSMYLPYPKSQVLYGWHQNYTYMMKKQVVFIVEAEKSVCQAASWGFNLLIAVGGHDISDTQARHIKSLGIDVIIAFDAGLNIEEVKEQAQKVVIDGKFWRNKVGYIDMSGIHNKVSPTDMGYRIFKRLVKERTKWI